MRGQNANVSAVDIDICSLSEAEIQREWKDIDLLVISEENNFVCAIENKVGASEHSNQLKKYEKIIEAEFKSFEHLFGFLTPEGTEASSPRWASISYSDIKCILDDFVEHYGDSVGNEINMAITHYLTLIKRYVVSDSEVARLCRKIYSKHQKAIDLIIEHRPDIQMFLKDLVEKLIEAKPDQLKKEHSTKAYIRFTHKNWLRNPIFLSGSGEWVKSENIMMFEVKNNDRGLFFSLIIGPGDPSVRKRIHEIALTNKSVFKGVYKPITPKYTQIFTRQLLTPKDFDKETDEIERKVVDKWNKILTDDVEQILALIDFDLMMGPNEIEE
jgi:hypothetical protein